MSALNQFFASQALHLRDGRIETMARPYAVPLLVVVERDFYLLRSSREVEGAFRAKFEALRTAGIGYLRASVLERRASSRERLRASVDWYYVEPSGARSGRTSVDYFLTRQNGAFTVAMMEFRRLAFPAIRDFFADRGRRATPAEMIASRHHRDS